MRKLKNSDPRVRVFATLCGLHDEQMYMPDTVQMYCLILRRLYPNHKQIAECWNSGYGNVNVRPEAVVKAFIGESATSSDIRTWDTPYFTAISSKSGILHIFDEIRNLPQRKVDKGGQMVGQMVDLDTFMELILFSYNAQLTARLKDTHRIFHEFDADRNEDLSLEEFETIMEQYMGGRFTEVLTAV